MSTAKPTEAPRADSDTLLAEAWARQSRRDYDGARALYRDLIQQDPGCVEARHQLGLIAVQQGQVAEAIEHLEAAVGAAPDDPDIRTSLGEALTMSGRISAAIEHLETARKLSDDDPDCLSALGEAYYRCDRSTKAVAIYERLLELEPGSVEVRGRLGVAIAGLRRGHPARDLDKAIGLLREGLRANPKVAALRISLARALGDCSRIDEAKAHFNELKKTYPNDIAVWSNLAEFYLLLGEADAGNEYYQRALKLAEGNPDYEARVMDRAADGFLAMGKAKVAIDYLKVARKKSNRGAYFDIKLGAAYLLAGWKEAAVESILPLIESGQADDDAFMIYSNALMRARRYETALEYLLRVVDPAALRWRTHFMIAECYQGLNRFAEAKRYLDELTAKEECFIEAYGFLIRDPDYELDGIGREQLKRWGMDQSLNFETRANAWFTLGRALRGEAKFKQSYRCFQKGNQIKRANVKYDVKYMDEMAAGAAWDVTPAAFASLRRHGAETATPIFILGIPRSGKSTLEAILAEHPEVHCLDEAEFLPRLKRDFTTYKQRQGEGAPENLAAAQPKVVKAFAKRLADRYISIANGKAHVTDTGPGNDLSLGLIALLLPRARLIFCQRDPLDVGVECYFKNFHSKLGYGFDLAEIGHFYRTCMEQREHWRPYFANPMTVMQFEDLMSDPEREIRRIYDFCGLDWRPEGLDSWLERKKIYTDSVGLHRHFEAHLEPLIEALGPYATTPRQRFIDQ